MEAAVSHSWEAKDLVPSVLGSEERSLFMMYDVIKPPGIMGH
jgi:hypothetical protein